MALSCLPYNVLSQIFQHLNTFDGRIRAGLVNRQFHELSNAAIRKATKVINLKISPFSRITPAGLTWLVNCCKSNLEEIIFSPAADGQSERLVEAFSRFLFPNLTTLDMDAMNCGLKYFAALVKNNPNLEYLIWGDGRPPKYPPRGVISENLRKLELKECDDACLRSFTGHCPNLEQLVILSPSISNGKIFDGFFARASKMQMIMILDQLHGVRVDELKNFWKLPSLRHLDLGSTSFCDTEANDAFLVKIAESFPRMENLYLDELDVTAVGIRALATLPRLSILQVDCDATIIDADIKRLAQRGRATELTLRGGIVTADTFITILRSCPDLDSLTLGTVEDVHGNEQAVAMFWEAASKPGKKILIEIQNCTWDWYDIQASLLEIAMLRGRRILW